MLLHLVLSKSNFLFLFSVQLNCAGYFCFYSSLLTFLGQSLQDLYQARLMDWKSSRPAKETTLLHSLELSPPMEPFTTPNSQKPQLQPVACTLPYSLDIGTLVSAPLSWRKIKILITTRAHTPTKQHLVHYLDQLQQQHIWQRFFRLHIGWANQCSQGNWTRISSTTFR